MQQVIRRGLKHIVVDEVPDPVVVPHHVVVQPHASLISSGTETASIHRDGLLKEVADNPGHLKKILQVMKTMGPIPTTREVLAKFGEYAVLGYSGAGVVAEVHPTVTEYRIGDRVAYGGEGTGHGEFVLTGKHLIAPIPDGVAMEAAAFTTLGSIALNAVRTADIGVGESVCVVGLGLVGQLVAQFARLGGGRVIGCDLQENRVNLARRLGADHGILGGAAARDELLGLTDGHGCDHVIIAAAAKSAAPATFSLDVCRDRGRITIVGAVDVSFPWLAMYLKEIEVRMARAYGPGSYDRNYEVRGEDYPRSYVRWTEQRNMAEVLRLIASGGVDVGPLVTHRFPLAQAPTAYDTIMTTGSGSLGVILTYPRASEPEAPPASPTRHTVAIGADRTTRSTGRRGVAVVGVANIARWAHMPALRAIRDAEFRAICSGGGARAKGFGRRFGAAYCTTDYQAILDDPEIQVVLIATRHSAHAAQALAALRAGKDVFVEKPMGLTVDECHELVAAASSGAGRVAVGFNRRFAPYYRAVKHALQGRTGPFQINCRVNSPGISGDYWMVDRSQGGAILGEACHFVDLLSWLLDAEPVTVSAVSFPREQQAPIPEDSVSATLRFADGSIANLTYGTAGTRTSSGERLEVYGPGVGVVSQDFTRLEVAGGVRRVRRKLFPDKGYTQQMEGFFRSLAGGTSDIANVMDGARATITCLRLLESARTGATVAVDWREALR